MLLIPTTHAAMKVNFHHQSWINKYIFHLNALSNFLPETGL